MRVPVPLDSAVMIATFVIPMKSKQKRCACLGVNTSLWLVSIWQECGQRDGRRRLSLIPCGWWLCVGPSSEVGTLWFHFLPGLPWAFRKVFLVFPHSRSGLKWGEKWYTGWFRKFKKAIWNSIPLQDDSSLAFLFFLEGMNGAFQLSLQE